MEPITLFDDGTLHVYHYGAGEVFVSNKISRVTARIGSYSGWLQVTSHNGTLEPSAVNGLPAFVVRP